MREGRGCCPPSRRASRPPDLARCSRECLIVTFGSVTLARGGEPPLPFEACAFKWLVRTVNLAPDSLIVVRDWFCCLFRLSFSYRSLPNCRVQDKCRQTLRLTHRPALTLSQFSGSEKPAGCWVAEGEGSVETRSRLSHAALFQSFL